MTFEGGIFHDSLKTGRAGARLELLGGRVAITTSEGQSFEVEVETCRYELGGATGKMLFCRSEDGTLTVFSEDPQFLRALARASGPRTRPWFRQAFARRRVQRRRRRIAWALAVPATLLLLFGISAGYGGVVRGLVGVLPHSLDVKLGQLAAPELLKGTELQTPDVVEPLQAMVERLLEGAEAEGFEFEVHVSRDARSNAFALPGGQMVVLTGLIEEAQGAEEVAGVLAHEIAHVTLRHGMQSAVNAAGLGLVAQLLIGDVSGLLALGAGLGLELARNGYSRDHEAAADARGVRLLHAAGLDPMALATFFQRLEASGEGGMAEVPGWMSSHPDHASRIAAVRALSEQLGPVHSRPLAVDWQRLRARVGSDDPQVAPRRDRGDGVPEAGPVTGSDGAPGTPP